MQRAEIKIKLTEVFGEVFGPSVTEIREEMTAADVKNWDSLNHVTLIYAAEQKFGVSLSVREIQGLKTVGDMFDLIEKKTGN